MNFFHMGDYADMVKAFFEYYLIVAGEELSDLVEFNGLRLSRAEAMITWYITMGYEILLVRRNGEIRGFVIYQVVFECVSFVRAAWLSQELQGKGMLKKLYEMCSRGKPVSKLIFQTLSQRTPDRLLSLTEGRRQEIHRDNRLITWEMRWENVRTRE